jgi:predicted metal-dependent hydrolase
LQVGSFGKEPGNNVFGKKEKILNDPQLGDILFRKNEQAKRYILRMKPNAVTVTIPYRGTYQEAEKFFMKNRTLVLQKLEELKEKGERQRAKDEAEGFSGHDEAKFRAQAKALLPTELERLATLHGFKYNSVKIRKTKTRWGSCSSKGNINLSLFLMQLPAHLIEYVLLHELCHTVQMNHSPAFWALLDKCTGGKAQALRKEIKKYKIP